MLIDDHHLNTTLICTVWMSSIKLNHEDIEDLMGYWWSALQEWMMDQSFFESRSMNKYFKKQNSNKDQPLEEPSISFGVKNLTPEGVSKSRVLVLSQKSLSLYKGSTTCWKHDLKDVVG